MSDVVAAKVNLDITKIIYFFYSVFFSNVQVPLLINLLKYVNLGECLIIVSM